MIHAPHMLLIGAAGRDAGKTVFACTLVNRFRHAPVLAAKVTAIAERDGTCPRGGEGCGVCSSLEGDFCITEETNPKGAKDTQRLLGAGARRVFWLRVLKERLEVGARALLDTLGPDTPVISESNSLRHAVEPGLFVMVRHCAATTVKASAQAVLPYADIEIRTDGKSFQFDFNRIVLTEKGWLLSDADS